MKVCDIQEILYQRNGFTVAWGEFQGGPDNLMMKWDNYPVRGWLIIPNELKLLFLIALLFAKGADRNKIISKLR